MSRKAHYTDPAVGAFVRRSGFRPGLSSRSARRRIDNLIAAKNRANPVFGPAPEPQPLAARPRIVEGVDVTSAEFLQTRAWKMLRYKALRLANGRCECCGASPQDGIRLNVDHIKPRRKRPDLALDIYNLQILCDACNAGKGNWDETDWR